MKQNINRLMKCAIGIAMLMAVTVTDAGSSVQCPAPHFGSVKDGFRYGFPPQIEKEGLHYASVKVPISRRDVRQRILREINYLLLDRRSRMLLWLEMGDYFKPVILPILKNYKLPPEFLYLAAIESSYNGRAMSSAGAFGYWQFIKSTAKCGPTGCPELDWTMLVSSVHDERGDIVKSTHAAARYLAWMNRIKKVSLDGKGDQEGFNDWLLATAAYNAGPTRVTQRLNSFGARSYWDVPLPPETERYVPRWIAVGLISKYRDFYGVQVPSRGGLTFDTLSDVRLKKDLSFAAIAKLLGTTPRMVWELNAHVPPEKAVFTARTGKKSVNHTIRVPKGKAVKFRAQLVAHGYTKK